MTNIAKEKPEIEPENGIYYEELYRPQFHYSPLRNWMNDPNGLIYHQGIYHLFYQYNPHGSQWGHMSWGHATSSDLMHWQEHDVAIPEGEFMIFSGTTAIYKNQIIAAYTSFEFDYNTNGDIEGKAQHQSLAVSKDGGFSFEDIEGNPIIDIDSKDFRDPKIFYDSRTQKWNMLVCLSLEHKIVFYQSDNLKDWAQVSQFGPLGNTDAVWECPDLFELALDDSKKTKWVLTVSAGHPQKGFLGMQYFLGDFNGVKFSADNYNYPLYLDYGKDFYAGITYANTKQKSFATMMGWLGCHHYSKDTPTQNWRGAMSLPRDLFLSKNDNDEILLKSNPPLTYIEPLIERTWKIDGLELYNGTVEVPFKSKNFVASLKIKKKNGRYAGIKALKSSEHETVIGVDFSTNEVFVDRRNSGVNDFNDKFSSKETYRLAPYADEIQLDVFVDNSAIEVFVQNGEAVITNLVFPDNDGDRIKIFAEGGSTVFEKIELKKLSSIWR